MLSASPDHRSRKALYNLNLALIASLIILAIVLAAMLSLSLGTFALPSAIFLTAILGSYVELGIVLCARPFFKANAFLQKSYRNILNYECSYALYSLPGIGFLIVLGIAPICLPNPSLGSTQIPGFCGVFALVYYFSLILGPLILLALLFLGLVAIGLLIGKFITFVMGAHKARQGKGIKYPLSITFFR